MLQTLEAIVDVLQSDPADTRRGAHKIMSYLMLLREQQVSEPTQKISYIHLSGALIIWRTLKKQRVVCDLFIFISERVSQVLWEVIDIHQHVEKRHQETSWDSERRYPQNSLKLHSLCGQVGSQWWNENPIALPLNRMSRSHLRGYGPHIRPYPKITSCSLTFDPTLTKIRNPSRKKGHFFRFTFDPTPL